MVVFELEKFLARDERSLRWVSRKTGIAASTLHNIAHQRTHSVTFDVLEKLCDLFQCGVEEIVVIKKDNTK